MHWTAGGADELRAAIVQRLQSPPSHFILRDPLLAADPDPVRQLLAPLAPQERLSFTQVRIDGQAAAKPSRGTRYSRTYLPLPLPLPLHTDTAHARRPHSLVAFLMLRPDACGGGRSIVASAAEILAKLDPAIIARLREPLCNFGRGPMPIVWGPAHAPSIRYYRTQIDHCAQGEGARLEGGDELDALDEALASFAESGTFWLDAGDLLLINNHKALHARTGFAPDSDRLMLRFRLRVRELE